MRCLVIVCFICLSFCLSLSAAVDDSLSAVDDSLSAVDDSFIEKIRPEHPRLFVNKDTIKVVKANAKGVRSDVYAAMKKTADGFMKQSDMQHLIYECALPYMMTVYWVEGDEKYKKKALQILRDGIPYLDKQFNAKKAVGWFSYGRISLLMGYDWLYDDLNPEERVSLAKTFMKNVHDMNNPKNKKISRENYGGFPGGGFYGVNNIKWYAGLTFHKEGIDDKQCVEWMKRGLADYAEVAAHRRNSAGDDGGMSAVTIGYVFGAYPRAEWNLIHTYQSAIGENISDRFSYLTGISNWVNWFSIKNGEKLYHFGAGDSHHKSNELSLSNLHLSQIQYFFCDEFSKEAAAAAYLREINPKKDYSGWHFEPFYALLLDWSKLKNFESQKPDETWPLARHFENLGHTFFRSSHDGDSSYALFNAGHKGASHIHADEGHFTIYHKGFLALDTGTRDQTKGSKLGKPHNAEYYNRTIAHNCVLVEMSGEKFGHHWGTVPKLNDGGQKRTVAGVIKAFSTNEHFAYSHVDLTPAYNGKKTSYIDRQFFFVPPFHYVIVDRVLAQNTDYAKTWLLHTQEKPIITDNIMQCSQNKGTLFSKTLYPKDAQLSLVGGPGHEFEVNGKNHPISKGYFKGAKAKDFMLGNWRLEVKPTVAQKNDIFVHVLEVGDKGKLKEMHDASIKDKGDKLLIHMDLGDKRTVDLSVSKSKPGSGSMSITKGKKELYSEKLSKKVQAQSGATGASVK
ncbi:MAG: heparinase II/III family protein [Planctomycetes bacterium]|nr:heparinase II/III family protein [Planctomycetota bacterium]